jgi:hypothetical protein
MELWDKSEKSLTGLIKALQSDACAPAPQPAGLSVQLMPHQTQALARMLQQEAAPLGFNSALWQSFQAPAGRTLWASLPLGKLSAEAPPKVVTGGFLGACVCVWLCVCGGPQCVC